MSVGTVPQWFPEYGVDLGAPAGALPASIDALRTTSGLYARRYARGVVVANPDSAPHDYAIDGTKRLVEPHGGGELPPSADTGGWGISTRAVSGSLGLRPHSGAVLLDP
jgi:hypothetical protein